MHRVRQSISICALATTGALALHSPAALAATYSFQTILYPGSTGTQANGINKSGVVVGTYSVIVDVNGEALTYFHGFKFANGQLSTVEPPNSQQSEINGIGDDGTIVGEYIENGARNPHLVAFTLNDGVFSYWTAQ